MTEYAFTFGWAHDDMHAGLGLGELSRGYVVIEAPNREVAREIGKGLFGFDKHRGGGETWHWAFDYELAAFDTFENRQDYPAGELLRIAWQQKVDAGETFGDISNERQWEWDREIEVLRDFIDSRQLNEHMVLYARQAANDEIEDDQLVRMPKPGVNDG